MILRIYVRLRHIKTATTSWNVLIKGRARTGSMYIHSTVYKDLFDGHASTVCNFSNNLI